MELQSQLEQQLPGLGQGAMDATTLVQVRGEESYSEARLQTTGN